MSINPNKKPKYQKTDEEAAVINKVHDTGTECLSEDELKIYHQYFKNLNAFHPCKDMTKETDQLERNARAFGQTFGIELPEDSILKQLNYQGTEEEIDIFNDAKQYGPEILSKEKLKILKQYQYKYSAFRPKKSVVKKAEQFEREARNMGYTNGVEFPEDKNIFSRLILKIKDAVYA